MSWILRTDWLGRQDKILARYTEQRDRSVDQVIIIPVKIDLKTDAGWKQIEKLVAANRIVKNI